LNLNLLNEFNPASNLISNKIWSKSTLTLWIFRWTNRNLRKREHDWLTSQGRNIWRNRIHNNKMAELTSTKVFIKQGKMWHPTWCASWLAPSLLRWLINLIMPCLFPGKWIPGNHFLYFSMFGEYKENWSKETQFW